MTEKALRHGYTTGATAAAAAKAATRILFSKEGETLTDPVTLRLPWESSEATEVFFMPVGARKGAAWSSCGIIKDGGDDPDVTHGMELRATASRLPGKVGVIEIAGGEGVGRVTRKGLAAKVGEAAINPVPRKMIRQAVMEALLLEGAPEASVRIVISAPEGVERAKRTLNHRLGIIGGISILGTTGIIIPMSAAA